MVEVIIGRSFPKSATTTICHKIPTKWKNNNQQVVLWILSLMQLHYRALYLPIEWKDFAHSFQARLGILASGFFIR